MEGDTQTDSARVPNAAQPSCGHRVVRHELGVQALGFRFYASGYVRSMCTYVFVTCLCVC